MSRRKKDLQNRFKFDSLYLEVQKLFLEIPDPRSYGCDYLFIDLLRMAFAMFSLKSPSLYSFQRRSKAESHNMKSIYGLESTCSDNCLRQGLDELVPTILKKGFVLFYQLLKNYGLLSHYQYMRKWKLVSIDGVEHFHSKKVHCSSCLTTKETNGEIHYSHSMLVAAMVHPEQREVFPLDCEPIVRQDGQEKNDCELNAARRLLANLKESYPEEPFLILEDALFANGPHIDQLIQYGFSYIIGVKPIKSKSLFAQFKRRLTDKPANNISYEDEKGYKYELSWVNNLPLNSTRADIRVNMLLYKQTNPKGKQTSFSWICNIKLHKRNAKLVMQAGRSRWKIENETFNTLKNQGYEFEHNFGHGYKHLSTVFAYIMLLAFTLDQAQQHGCILFSKLWTGLNTKLKLWQALRAAFVMVEFKNMEQLFKHIAQQYQIHIDSS